MKKRKNMPSFRRWLICAPIGALLLTTLSTPATSYAGIVPKGQQGCAPGTVVAGPNLVFNGDFSIDPGPGPGISPEAKFDSDLPNRGSGRYPNDEGDINGDNRGGFSIQRGYVTYFDNRVIGRPFPGDSRREVPATDTYFYSNPYYPSGTSSVLLWRQTATGLAPRSTYNFFAYFDNLLLPDSTAADPIITLRVNGVAAGDPIVVAKQPDDWQAIQYSFTTDANPSDVVLEIYDSTGSIDGDDFGMTQISLKQCVSGLGIAKDVSEPVAVGDAYDIEYRIKLKNYGVVGELELTNLQVVDNLAATFAGAASWELRNVDVGTLTKNPAYDGRNNTRLLAGTDTFPSQSEAVITIVARVRLGSGPNGRGPFNNTAVARAQAGNVIVEDDSIPGPNPDPNNNGDPKEGVEDKPTPISFGGSIYLPLIGRP